MDAPGNDVRLAGRAQEKTAERVWVVTREHTALQLDLLATEEPLEIRLRAAGLARRHAALAVLYRRGQEAQQRTVAITMRTPGNDFELAAGFLYGEGVIRSAEDIRQVTHCDDRSLDDARRHNIVNVDLRNGVLP
ncbi:MAG TPA: formate dehydrogenase accessory sulfurtransferase FdhD, partial [Vicinamibacteria bacterium]|nr:formate dehydrogenase accessory sulfurtransferase FdhD [Vicinamibacteria bacterium]